MNTNPQIPPEVRTLLEPLAQWLVLLVKEAASKQLTVIAYQSAKTAPMPPNTFRRLCRTGVFTSALRVGGEWRARSEDVDAWLAKQQKPTIGAKASTGQDLDAMIFGNGKRS